jgi:hypothetical protein
MKNSSLFITSLISLSIILSGCLRGETKTLSEIQSIAKDRFTQASKDGLDPDVSAAVSALNEKLAILGTTEVTSADTLASIEGELSKLLPLAGYPVRPAFTEVRNEFLEASSGTVNQAQAKLLAFRAYNILAEELAQGRFKIDK